MTDRSYNVIASETGVPIKAWTKGVSIEPAAEQQLRNVASMPFVYKWVAAMPDVHWGLGATVGSVIPTREAIIPAAVGRKDADVIDEIPALEGRQRPGTYDHLSERHEIIEFQRGE